MSVVQTLRRQHSDIAASVRAISAELRVESLANPAVAAAMRTEISKLAGLVKVHLSMEDKSLYPSLVASKDSTTATTAKRFVMDMTPISNAFGVYMSKWPNAESIAKQPAAFVQETQAVFKALGERVTREERELYPLAEAA